MNIKMASFLGLYDILDQQPINMDRIKAYIDTIPSTDNPVNMHITSSDVSDQKIVEILEYVESAGFDIYTQEMWNQIIHLGYISPAYNAVILYYDHGFIPTQTEMFKNMLTPEDWDFFKYTHERFPQISLFVEGNELVPYYTTNNFSRHVLGFGDSKWGRDKVSTYTVIKYLFENGDTPCAEDGGFIKDLTKWKNEFGPKTINKLYKLALSQPCIRNRPELLYLFPKEMRDEMAVQLFEKGRIFLDIPGFDAWTIEEILNNLEEMNGVSLEHARYILMEMAQRYSRIKQNK